MQKLLLFIITFLMLGMFSCDSDLHTIENESKTDNNINNRSKGDKGDDGGDCQAGSISEFQGMLKFADVRSFYQTIDFLGCASEQELQNWRQNNNVETSMKAFLAFREATTFDNVNSIQELLTIESQYDGKIKVTVDEEAKERSHDVEYKYIPELVDVDGIFMVGNDMVRIIEDRMIRVKNATREDMMNLTKDATPTENENPSDGDVIDNTEITLRGGGDCCPEEVEVERIYSSSGLKKLTAEYWFETFYFKATDPNGTFSFAQLLAKAKVKHEKRKKFIFWSYWGNDATSLLLNAELKGEYTLGDIGNPQAVTEEGTFDVTLSGTASNASSISRQEEIGFISNAAAQKPVTNKFTVCVEEADLTGVNTANNISVDFNCGETIQLPDPSIIFYEDNNCGGDIVCILDLDPSVGYLNFTDYQPCKNDEVRSARLLNMRQGMRFRVFDNSEMKLDDDFTIVDIKQNFASRQINTFENDSNDSQMQVNYFPDNGLDGKISSFIDN